MKNKFSSSTRKRGGQPGNKNAVGNKGGAPKGNKNRLTHGLYEKIDMTRLTDDEWLLIASIPRDTVQIMRTDLALLCVREKRMHARIAFLRKASSSEDMYAQARTSHRVRTQKSQAITEDAAIQARKAAIDCIQDIEEQLTKLLREKIRLIKALHTYEIQRKKLDMEKMRYEHECGADDDVGGDLIICYDYGDRDTGKEAEE